MVSVGSGPGGLQFRLRAVEFGGRRQSRSSSSRTHVAAPAHLRSARSGRRRRSPSPVRHRADHRASLRPDQAEGRSDMTTSLVAGGSGGLERFIAEHLAGRGDDVIIANRTSARAQEVVAEFGPRARHRLGPCPTEHYRRRRRRSRQPRGHRVRAVPEHPPCVRHDATAIGPITIKLVGYTEVVRTLHSRTGDGAASDSN